ALYRCHQHDAWPDSLEQLVPDYLPSVPLDPLAAGARAFKYASRSATTQPFIYSVGEDGTDDGGSITPRSPKWKRVKPFEPWNARDAVYHLSRQPREPEASDAAEDNPADQHGGGGNSK